MCFLPHFPLSLLFREFFDLPLKFANLNLNLVLFVFKFLKFFY